MTFRHHPAPLPDSDRARLYLIVDPRSAARAGVDAIARVRAALRGGVGWVQVRMKGASTREIVAWGERLAPVVHAEGAALLVNDDVDAALACAADGVHIGQSDAPLREVQRRARGRLWIGVSTHSAEQARAAALSGADYAGIGAMFPTATKHGARVIGVGVLSALQDLGAPAFPLFPIGGIQRDNLREIVRAGVRRAAVSAAILDAADAERAARDLRLVLDSSPRAGVW